MILGEFPLEAFFFALKRDFLFSFTFYLKEGEAPEAEDGPPREMPLPKCRLYRPSVWEKPDIGASVPRLKGDRDTSPC